VRPEYPTTEYNNRPDHQSIDKRPLYFILRMRQENYEEERMSLHQILFKKQEKKSRKKFI